MPRRLAAGLVGDVHGNHHVGAQLARSIHWHGADDAAINEMVLADHHRLEHPRHAARCAHRLARIAAREHGALAVLQPCGNGHERLGQLLQGLAAHLRVHVVLQLLALHQPARGQLEVADLGFVQRHGLFLQLKGIHAAGVQRTHHTAGAGARHHGGCETVGFQHLEDTDMGKPLGSAPAQCHPHLDGRRRWRWRGDGGLRLRHRGRGRWVAAAGGKAEKTGKYQRAQREGQAHGRTLCCQGKRCSVSAGGGWTGRWCYRMYKAV